jgi:ATP-dependent RNA helicase DeaD
VDDLVSALQLQGYQADALHGDLKQSSRDRVMDKFRSGHLQLLVATDVAARGIDVDNIDIVFNYDIPQDEEYYVHRIGRTARAGKTGRAFSFVSGRNDSYELRDIMRYANVKITLQRMPTQDDVEGSKLLKLTEQLREMLANGGFERYSRTVEQIMGEEFTALDVAAVLLSMQMGTNLAEVTKEASIELPEPDHNGMIRLIVNMGREDRITPRDIVGAIAGETGISGRAIGSIEIYDRTTCVEVPVESAREVISIMRNAQIRGQRVTIEPTRSRDRESGRVGGRSTGESRPYGGEGRPYNNEGRSGGRNEDDRGSSGSAAPRAPGRGGYRSGGDRGRTSRH